MPSHHHYSGSSRISSISIYYLAPAAISCTRGIGRTFLLLETARTISLAPAVTYIFSAPCTNCLYSRCEVSWTCNGCWRHVWRGLFVLCVLKLLSVSVIWLVRDSCKWLRNWFSKIEIKSWWSDLAMREKACKYLSKFFTCSCPDESQGRARPRGKRTGLNYTGIWRDVRSKPDSCSETIGNTLKFSFLFDLFLYIAALCRTEILYVHFITCIQ